MSMISYAQNREDVLLRRAFPEANGFYIDVGAAHPICHSVTKTFYESGWTGINVEPVASFFSLLEADRPRDTNLNIALSDHSGEMELFEIQSSMGMSTIDRHIYEQHLAEGRDVSSRTVHVSTLSEICEKYVTCEIDFLKIDVEGAERQVIAGADFKRWRPRVLTIEATNVGQATQNHEQWEQLVLDAGYLFAAFDGLNRYYVRVEDRDLASAFSVPVNVFDDYVLAETIQLQAELTHVRNQYSDQLNRLKNLETQHQLVLKQLDEARAEITSLTKFNQLAVLFLQQTREQLHTTRTQFLPYEQS